MAHAEELVVVGRAFDVVVVVGEGAAEDAGKDAVGHPGKVETAVGLGEEARDDDVVGNAREGMLGQERRPEGGRIDVEALDENVDGNLEEGVGVGVLDGLERRERATAALGGALRRERRLHTRRRSQGCVPLRGGSCGCGACAGRYPLENASDADFAPPTRAHVERIVYGPKEEVVRGNAEGDFDEEADERRRFDG